MNSIRDDAFFKIIEYLGFNDIVNLTKTDESFKLWYGMHYDEIFRYLLTRDYGISSNDVQKIGNPEEAYIGLYSDLFQSIRMKMQNWAKQDIVLSKIAGIRRDRGSNHSCNNLFELFYHDDRSICIPGLFNLIFNYHYIRSNNLRKSDLEKAKCVIINGASDYKTECVYVSSYEKLDDDEIFKEYYYFVVEYVVTISKFFDDDNVDVYGNLLRDPVYKNKRTNYLTPKDKFIRYPKQFSKFLKSIQIPDSILRQQLKERIEMYTFRGFKHNDTTIFTTDPVDINCGIPYDKDSIVLTEMEISYLILIHKKIVNGELNVLSAFEAQNFQQP